MLHSATLRRMTDSNTAQQHPPAAFCSTFCPNPLMVDFAPGPDAIEVDPMRSLICFDMVKKACFDVGGVLCGCLEELDGRAHLRTPDRSDVH